MRTAAGQARAASLAFVWFVAAVVSAVSCAGEPGRFSNETIGMSASPPDGYVDRVEGRVAVIVTDDDRVVDWPAGGLREGDVLRDGSVDRVATAEQRARVEALRLRLSREDDPREDLDL